MAIDGTEELFSTEYSLTSSPLADPIVIYSSVFGQFNDFKYKHFTFREFLYKISINSLFPMGGLFYGN